MLKHILKRIGFGAITLLILSFLIYLIMRLQPDDFIYQRFGSMLLQDGGAEQLERIREMLGLNHNIIVGYWLWLSSAIRGDFGYSLIYNRYVADVMFERMGLSFIMGLIALVVTLAIAIPMGIVAATRQYSKYDYVTTALVMMGISMPSFFFAGLLIYIFVIQLGWWPAALGLPSLPPGTNSAVRFFNNAWALVLPITVMVVLGIGGMMRHTRTNTLEVLRSDFIRTARAKGLSEGAVIYKHAFKNTAVPMVTMAAGILPGLFAGSIIIEQVFALPGVGQVALSALQGGDIPLVMGFNMFMAVLSVLGVLIADILYVVVDPRIKMN